MVSDWITDLVDSQPYTTAQEVYETIEREKAQLWIAWGENTANAVCVTQVETHAKTKGCYLWLMAGRSLEQWKHLVLEIEQWAKAEGCTFMRSEVRPGLKKALAQFGYKSPRVVLEKEIKA